MFHLAAFLVWVFAVLVFLTGAHVQAQTSNNRTSKAKRPITVPDAIGMTTIGAPDYFGGESSRGSVAHFSPNGEKFVVVLRKGNLEQNANDFSLFLYDTADVFHAPKPDLLLEMSSSSDRNAIGEIRWLADNETVVFLGGNSDEPSQLYAINVNTKSLQKVTNHPTAITDYDITSDGHEIVFAANPPVSKKMPTDQERRGGVVIQRQWLADLLVNNLGDLAPDPQLFLQPAGKHAVPIPLNDRFHGAGSISISPDGHYALVGTWLRDIPFEWSGYQEKRVHAIVTSHKNGELALLSRYQLLDATTGSVVPLLNAPMLDLRQFIWASDSHAVSLKTYLPLDVVNPAEKEARSKSERPAEVTLPGRELRTITEEEFRKRTTSKDETLRGIDVTLEEGINTPPRIYANDPKTKRNASLLELNPQFSELNFGKVESISWNAADGKERTGGLFLPPDDKLQERYPLVIQTHGFWQDRFSMDGSPEWSSAFAARMLAAKGFVVLQVRGIPVSGGPDEGPSFMAMIEGAIEDLGQKGLIDRDRVGISGFSRTVYEVGYILTHSKYKFSAANLVDGITGGYMDYLAWGDDSEAALNGGPPFGDRLELWLKNSPGFNLDKVNPPVRLVALGAASVLEMWEWFAGLRLQNKPVDFIAIPDGTHLLQKPWDRRIAMQGIVDWYCFWLKGEEDPNPAKSEQYARWRELRKLQEENEKKSRAPAN